MFRSLLVFSTLFVILFQSTTVKAMVTLHAESSLSGLPYHPFIKGADLLLMHKCEDALDNNTVKWRDCEKAGLRLTSSRSDMAPKGSEIETVHWVKVSSLFQKSKEIISNNLTTRQSYKSTEIGIHLELPMACFRGAFSLGTTATQIRINHDRFPDYVISSNCGGLGLMSYMHEIWILVSDVKGIYHATQMFHLDDQLTWIPPLKNKTAQFIQRGFAGTGKVLERNNKNYWIYWRWQLRNGKFMPTHHAPIWVRYTNKPNNKAENNINAAQRKMILSQKQFWYLNAAPKYYY